MITLNGLTVVDDGNRTSLGIGGVDVFNPGCTDCGTVRTADGGMRIRATDDILLGAAIEKTIARDAPKATCFYLDMIRHFRLTASLLLLYLCQRSNTDQ